MHGHVAMEVNVPGQEKNKPVMAAILQLDEKADRLNDNHKPIQLKLPAEADVKRAARLPRCPAT